MAKTIAEEVHREDLEVGRNFATVRESRAVEVIIALMKAARSDHNRVKVLSACQVLCNARLDWERLDRAILDLDAPDQEFTITINLGEEQPDD